MNKIIKNIIKCISTGDKTYIKDFVDQEDNLVLEKQIEIENEYKQYKIDSVLLEMVKEIYDAIPSNLQDVIPQETKTKYNQLKNFLDSKI